MSTRKKDREIKRKVSKIKDFEIEMKTEKQKPFVKPTAEQISLIQSARTLGGNAFQNNMEKLLRGYGVGKTPLVVPKINVLTRKEAANGSKSVYDFHDAVNNIVYEMAQSVSDGKEAKIEKDILSVKIYNPDIKYIAVVEVEKDSEKYRKNKSSYELLEESVDHVCYGENDFRDYLRNTYTKHNYYEGKLIDVDVDDIDMLEFNRDINDKWVQALVDYILRYGFITNIVVVPYHTADGKMRYKIIDGNHRFKAKKQLMEDGIYPMGKDGIANKNKIQVLVLDWIDGNNNKLVHQICIQMNMTNRTWEIIDYIESFLKFFKMEGMVEQEKDYQMLMETYYKYDKAMTPVYIMVNEGLRNFEVGMGKVKEGKWVCDKQIYYQITAPLLDLYNDILSDPVTYGKYTKTALQWLLTFIKVEMVKRLDDFSFNKLLKVFVKNIQAGKYKMYSDVNDIRDKLIPMLASEFQVEFPLGTKDENPLEEYKFLTAKKTIDHFIYDQDSDEENIKW